MKDFELPSYSSVAAGWDAANNVAGLDKVSSKKAAVIEASQRKRDELKPQSQLMQERLDLIEANGLAADLRGGFVDSDMARKLSESAIRLGGSTTEVANFLEDKISDAYKRTANKSAKEEGRDVPYPEMDYPTLRKEKDTAISRANDYMANLAEVANKEQSLSSKEALDKTMIKGDPFDMSTWRLPEDPSLQGAGMLAADLVGQYAPMILTGSLFGKGAASLLGATQGGGSQAAEMRSQIDQMSDSELAQNMPKFKQLMDIGVSSEDARKTIQNEARTGAMAGGTALGSIGGAGLHGLIKDVPAKLTGNALSRTLKGTLYGGAQEGLQEGAETMAARQGANLATGGNLDLDQGILTDMTMGALGGASTSLVGTTTENASIAAQKRVEAKAQADLERRTAMENDIKDTGDVLTYVQGGKLKTQEAFDKLTQFVEDKNSPEAKKVVVDQSNALVKRLEDQVKSAKDQLAISDPVKVEEDKAKSDQLVEKIKLLNTQLKTAEKSEKDAIVNQVEQLTDELSTVNGRINSATKFTPEEYQVALEKQQENENVHLAKFRAIRDSLVQKVSTPAQPTTEATQTVTPEMAIENAAKADQIDQQIQTLTQSLDTATDENKNTITAEISRLRTESSNLRQYIGAKIPANTSATVSKPVDTLIADISSTATDTDAISRSDTASDDLITLAMESPDQITTDHIDALERAVNDENSTLSPHQKKVISNIAEARRLEASMKRSGDVSNDVLYGNLHKKDAYIKFNGLDNYRRDFAKALKSDPSGKTTKEPLAAIGRFRDFMAGKSQALKDAYSDFQGVPIYVSRNSKGDWIRTPTFQAGGFKVDSRTPSLIAAVDRDLQLLNNGFKELNATLSYVQSKGTDKGTKVKVVKRDNVRKQVPTQVTSSAPAQSVPVTPSKPTEASNGQEVQKTETEVTPTTSSPAVAEGTNGVASATTQVPSVNSNEQIEAPSVTDAQTPTETSTEAKVEPSSTSGKLSIFADAKGMKEFTPDAYSENENMLARMFKQSAGKESSTTLRPLVVVKDFLTTVLKGDKKGVRQFLEGGIDKYQSAALLNFITRVEDFNQVVKSLLAPHSSKQRDYWFQNPLLFLYKDDGKGNIEVDENLLTAVSSAMYSYLSQKASKPYNDDYEINSILGRSDKKKRVSFQERQKMRFAGEREDIAVQTLGPLIIDALGISVVNDQVPMNELPRLTTALGALALESLKKTGLIQAHTVSFDDFPSQTFIRVAQTNATNRRGLVTQTITEPRDRTGQIQQIVETNRKSGNVISKLMGTKAGVTEPSLKPLSFTKTLAKRTRMLIPKKQQEVLDREGKMAHRFSKGPMNFFAALDSDIQDAAIGITSLKELENTLHTVELSSIEAKNAGLLREKEHLLTWFEKLSDMKNEKGEYPPFYLNREVTKVQRVQLVNSLVNPQGSKVHRFLIGMDQWNTDVDVSTDNAVHTSFKLRVVEGFGFKTDKKRNAEGIAEFDKLLNDAKDTSTVLGKGIAAIRKSPEELTREDQEAFKDAIADYEKLHTAAAMFALRDYIDAMNSDTKKFTSNLIGEVDGVTNGPMLAMQWLGAQYQSFMAKGGFFKKAGDGETQYKDHNLWKAEGNEDLYEHFAKEFISNLSVVAKEAVESKPMKAAALNMLLKYAGNFAEVASNKSDTTLNITNASNSRDFVKQPVTATTFGSGKSTIIEDMGKEVVNSIYTRFGEINQMTDPHLKFNAFNAWVKDINSLVSYGSFVGKLPKAAPVPLIRSLSGMDEWIKVHRELEFTPNQEAAIKAAFSNVMGRSIRSTIDNVLGVFIKRRNALNNAAQTAFWVYRSAYAAMKQQEIDRLIAEGKIRTAGGKNTPVHDLTEAQDNAIREKLKFMLPAAPTAFALQSEGEASGPAAGIYFGKRKKSFTKSFAYGVDLNINGKSKTYGSEYITETDSGVAALITQIHSSDSAIAMTAYMELFALNLHDALGVGVADLTEAAQKLNKATYHTLLNHSVPSAIYDRLEAVLVGADNLLKESPEIYQNQFKQAFSNWLKEEYPNTLTEKAREHYDPATHISQVLKEAKTASYQANYTNLTHLSEMGYVNQYSSEGGFYEVTEADRQAALDKREKLIKDVPKEVEDSLKNLLGSIGYDLQETTEPVVNTPPDSVVIQPGKFHEHWANRLGTPEVMPNPDWVKFFEGFGDSEIPVSAVIEKLKYQVKHSALHSQLLEYLIPKIKETLTFRYVTPDTDPSTLNEKGVVSANGWFVTSKSGKTKDTIYVRSPDFKKSAVTSELVMHELLHAGLVRTIEHAQTDSADPELKALYNELEALRKRAKEVIDAMPASSRSQFTAGVKNVHELVSWGLTSVPFQIEVLDKIKDFKRQTIGNKFISGLKAFLNNVTKLIFKRNADETIEAYGERINQHGLSVLITNTAGLLSAPIPEVNVTKTLAMASSVDQMSTQQLFDSIAVLGNESIGLQHETKLRNVIEQIINKVRTPFEIFNTEQAASPAVNPDENYIQTLANNSRPFVSDVHASGFKLAPQVSFVLENVEAVVRSLVENPSTAPQAYNIYKMMERIYREARHVLTPESFHKAFRGTDYATAPVQEQEEAQRKYDYVFTESGNGGTSDAVSRFAAMAMTIPEFESMLDYNSYKEAKNWRNMNWPTRIREAFSWALNVLNDLMSGTWTANHSGKAVNAQIRSLVDSLTAIDNRRRTALKKSSKFNMNLLDDYLKRSRVATGTKLAKLADSGVGRRFTVVKGVGVASKIVVSNQVARLAQEVNNFRDRHFRELPGLVNGLYNEVRGMADNFLDMVRATKHIETVRHEIDKGVTAQVKAMFANNGAALTDAIETKITEVFLQPALHDLLDHFNLGQLQTMLADPKVLKFETLKLERQLRNNPNELFYLREAKDLGFFLITERSRNGHLLKNAHNIARMLDTGFTVTEAQANAVEPVIDQLISLYALTHVHEDTRKAMAGLMLEESSRTDGGNGIEFLLKYTKTVQDEALTNLFDNNKVQTTKGYIPQLLDESIEVVAATDAEGVELLARGWVKGAEIVLDVTDPNQTKRHLYVLTDSGSLKWLSGAVSLTTHKARGNKQHGSFFNQDTREVNQASLLKNAKIRNRKRALIAEIASTPRNYKPEMKKRENHMVPVMNPAGDVVNYSYMMNADTKNGIMRRDLRMSAVIGKYASNNYDKQASSKQNRIIVEALKQQYVEDFSNRPQSYLEVSATSAIPELRQIWKNLPEQMKMDVKEVWDAPAMYVPADVARQIFGYRERSLVSPLLKSDVERLLASKAEKRYVRTLEKMFKAFTGKDEKLAGLYLRQVGVAVDELNTFIKDVFVIRTGTTLLWNMVSNYTQLWANGLSLRESVGLTQKFLVATLEYKNQVQELNQLKAMRDAQYVQGTVKDLEQDIIRLEDAINRNPVKELVDAGLMPTIVEDVSMEEEDPYSYKSKLLKKSEKFTKHIPSGIKTASKYLMVSPDTPMYKVFHQGTQLSDFVARAALIHHLVNDKNNPMTKEAAIRKAAKEFVNYDILTHPALQWLDSTGLTRFTKYYLRIQVPLLKLMRDKPARMLALAVFGNYFDGMQTLWDAAPRLSDPIEGSVLDVFDAWNDPILMKAAGSVVAY